MSSLDLGVIGNCTISALVDRTGTIGAFIITSEEAVSAGVRRIEARVGAAAIDYLRELRARERRLAGLLGVNTCKR